MRWTVARATRICLLALTTLLWGCNTTLVETVRSLVVVEGIVLENGEAAPGVTVEALELDRPLPVGTAVTDDQGRYRFEDEFKNTIYRFKPDLEMCTPKEGEAHFGPGSDTITIDFECQSLHDVSGTIRFDGQPRSGLPVELTRDGWSTVTERTDASGRYRFADLEQGNYQVQPILDPNWICDRPGPIRVDLGAADEVIDITCVPPFGSISGIVVVEEVGILQGVEVTLDGPVGMSTTTGADGRYVFEDLPPGEYLVRLGDTPAYVFEKTAVRVEVVPGATLTVDFQGASSPETATVGVLMLDQDGDARISVVDPITLEESATHVFPPGALPRHVSSYGSGYLVGEITPGAPEGEFRLARWTAESAMQIGDVIGRGNDGYQVLAGGCSGDTCVYSRFGASGSMIRTIRNDASVGFDLRAGSGAAHVGDGEIVSVGPNVLELGPLAGGPVRPITGVPADVELFEPSACPNSDLVYLTGAPSSAPTTRAVYVGELDRALSELRNVVALDTGAGNARTPLCMDGGAGTDRVYYTHYEQTPDGTRFTVRRVTTGGADVEIRGSATDRAILAFPIRSGG